MTESLARTAFASLCGQTADACRKAVHDHVLAAPAGLRFQRQILFALATLVATASLPELEDADIRLVRAAVDDAAAVWRTKPPDAATVELVERFEEVVAACDAALGTAGHPLWDRFLFEDADVEVRRSDGRWHVRTGAGEAVSRLLDIALDRLLTLSSHRIGELTVQILDWYERPLR